MTAPRPLVTVIIPARNEQADIAGCIDAVAAQDHGADRIQLVVVDAASDDGTVEEVVRAAAAHRFAEVVVEGNPRRRTSVGLNVGLDRAKGEYVARVDARSRVAPGYVSTCLRAMADHRVGVVGGAQVALARSAGLVDTAIARALRNRYGTGLSRYRRGRRSGPSDTVWMGFFRTGDLRAMGGWSEAVALNEDFELNRRYREAGYLVWFDSELRSLYLPRRSLALLARQYFYFGRVKGTWWARGDRPTLRQAALLAAPVVAGGLAALAYRKAGPATLLAVPGALLAVEAAGSDEPAPLTHHALAAATIALTNGSWWAGTVVGFAGDKAGLRHQHG